MDDNNNLFMYNLNSKLDETERILKLSGAVLNRDNTLSINFIVNAKNYDLFLTTELKAKIEKICKEQLPENIVPIFTYKKTITDENYIKKSVMDFIYNQSPLIFQRLSECEINSEIEYDTVKIQITVPSYIYSFMNSNGYAEKMANYIDSTIMEQVEVEILLNNKPSDQIVIVKTKPHEFNNKMKLVEISDVKPVIGIVVKRPKYISSVNSEEAEGQTICGKVANFQEKVAKNTQKHFFTMVIDDTTGKIEAVFFPRDDKTIENLPKVIKDDIEICAEGDVRFSKYSGGYSLMIRKLALCEINYLSINNKIEYLKEDDNYHIVFPEPFVEEVQSNMFDDESEQKRVSEALKGDYVVFDLETTGIDYREETIIEIGAVKMHDGVIIEKFSTLINPQKHIPEQATKVNNIHDEDVQDAPQLSEVIGDFYKFTRNATLVGHNIIGFDIKFLQNEGNKYHYNFDNALVDTYVIAKEKVQGKTNLGALCQKFNIQLINAHRAWADAEATARVLIKLCLLK